jgi:flagellar protein FliO/FliZ
MDSIWTSLAWFAVVVLAIPALLWLFKVSPLGRLHGFKPELTECPMKPMASLAIAPGQKLMTVEVGQGPYRRWLVLGVTAGSITTLDRIDPGRGSALADPAWHNPQLHTERPPSPGYETADTGMMATQRLDRLPEPPARSSASVLPFADVLAQLRRKARPGPEERRG